MTDKQIIEEDMVNAKDFCPHYPCQVDCYEARMCPFFVETLQKLEAKEKECEELKKQACGLRPELKYIINKTCCKYNINAKYYHEKIVEIINNLDKYTQTLTEIKEIVIKTGIDHKWDMRFQRWKAEILQKIKEVENGRN